MSTNGLEADCETSTSDMKGAGEDMIASQLFRSGVEAGESVYERISSVMPC